MTFTGQRTFVSLVDGLFGRIFETKYESKLFTAKLKFFFHFAFFCFFLFDLFINKARKLEVGK